MNTTTRTTLIRIWIIGLALGLLAGPALANTVRLKRGAVVEPEQRVVLAKIAELDGAYASALGDLVIAERAEDLLGPDGTGEIAIDRVRRLLHREGAVLGRLELSGSVCRVRSTEAGGPGRPEADPDETSRSSWRTLDDWRSATEQTVEIAIVRRFMSEFGVSADRLRLKFGSGSSEILEMSTATRRTVIEPVSVMSSAVALLRVERYAPSGSLELSETIAVEAQILRGVLKLRQQVSRRQAIPGGILEASEEWLPPAVDAVGADEGAALVGQIAQTRLEAGKILLRSQIEEPIAVQRNALVEVIYHGDGFVLKTNARSREAGRRGDIIEVRVEGSRSGFLARVDAPGRVIVVK